MDIKIFKDKDITEAAALALNHKLFVNGWDLSKMLEKGLQSFAFFKAICLAFEDDKPVSVVVVTNKGFSAAYVKDAFRRKGIASRCVKALRDSGIEPVYCASGVIGSLDFWASNNIQYRSYEGLDSIFLQ